MKKTQYSNGFEKFWKVWLAITRRGAGKPEAYAYWKKGKYEGDTDWIIESLRLQGAERKRDEKHKQFVPEWCFAQKWLNPKKRRFEYRPEAPVKKTQKPKIKVDYVVASEEDRVAARKEFNKIFKPKFKEDDRDFETKRKEILKGLDNVQ